jgi:hypothetical protein
MGSNSPEFAWLANRRHCGRTRCKRSACRDRCRSTEPSLARVANRVQHAFDTALAEAARNEDAVEALQAATHTRCRLALGVLGLQPLGLDPGHAQLQVVRERAMHQRLLQRLVAVFILDILTDDGDRDLVLRVVGAVDDVLPLCSGQVPSHRSSSTSAPASPHARSAAKVSGTS